jgi:hypothetical protein
MNDHIRSEDLAAYVDGLLSAESNDVVENHIAGCPECLDELAEVAALLENREKIPARFLEQALGKKKKAGRSILPLRLVFEVAAAVVVVVFIGYLFLTNNRFWQVPGQKKPAEVAAKDVQRAAPADAGKIARRAADAGEMKSGAGHARDEKELVEQLSLKKAETKTADKSVPASSAAAPVLEKEDRLQAKLEERPQVVVANETAPQKEAAAEPTAPGAVGGVALDSAAKRQAVAGVAKGKAAPLLPVRIEGEAGVSDLRNPELLYAWSWLQEGLALELAIDGAGNVVGVVSEGEFAPPAAKQAETEARKLLFSTSDKKLRRVRVVAEPQPPN